ncbi:MAG TPA: hypothetical protein VLD19_17900 [Chitinophagaceae bacterium]|nr:hypothetical protein [Chitinophagaceae bacterium]
MKITSLLLCAIIPAAMSAGAQIKVQAQAPGNETSWPATVINDSSYSKPGYINNISTSAVRDFMRRFKTTDGTRWFRADNGFCIARFNEGGIEYQVDYNARGTWIYTLRSYKEKLLARDIRHLVKSTYYDYAITHITEVEQYNIEGIVYLVYLEDETCYMTLRMHDGEMDVMEKMFKANKK